MKPDPRQKRLREHLKEHPLKVGAWSGFAFRSTSLRHGRSTQLLSGEGALTHAGRWNPPGKFRAVYLSLSPEASVAEVFQTAGKYGFAEGDLRPRLTAAVRVKLTRVADLRPDAKAVSAVCSLAELLGEDWRSAFDQARMTVSPTLGSLLASSGIEGFLVPSATGQGAGNMIIFNDNLQPGSSMEVCGANELDDALLRKDDEP